MSEREKSIQKLAYTYSQLIRERVSQDALFAIKPLESIGSDSLFVSDKVDKCNGYFIC